MLWEFIDFNDLLLLHWLIDVNDLRNLCNLYFLLRVVNDHDLVIFLAFALLPLGFGPEVLILLFLPFAHAFLVGCDFILILIVPHLYEQFELFFLLVI